MTLELPEIKGVLGDKPSSKKTRLEKPYFQDFLISLQNVLDVKGNKDQAPVVFRLIKKGFKERIENIHINEICKELLSSEIFPRLCLRISVEASTGQSANLIRQLIGSLRKEMATRTDFPMDKIPLITYAYDPNRVIVLEGWIKSNSIKGILDHDWARMALGIIINDQMTHDEFHIVQLILKNCRSRKSKKLAVANNVTGKSNYNIYLPFIKQIGNLFTSKKYNSSKIDLALEISDLLHHRYQYIEKRVEDLSYNLRNEKSLSSKLKTKLEALEIEKGAALQKIQELQEDIYLKEQSILKEKERFKTLDSHWKEKCSRELAGLSHSIKKYFDHEVREVKLSLDRENANIKMALDRIRNMEEYLKKMG